MTSTPGLVLLDTNTLIHLLKATTLGGRIADEHSLKSRSDRPLISIVTVGEALAFATKRGWGAPRITKLRELIHQLVIVDINSTDVLEHYAALDAFCEVRGRALGKNDLWIAATTAATGALLLTTDKDFDPLHQENLLRRVWYDPVQG
ncbi:type II toxin-antitoxin system VapC family toxin [Archangium violaceum]|uniref:type II toxin-antitoxin system VapC family toxin n=1 Tax=Archangium violaceum TaxID=83451 RepID=UPI002B3114B0|nr:type II toxin-antitoxin system VapC family toxin [Archangium violaceum]